MCYEVLYYRGTEVLWWNGGIMYYEVFKIYCVFLVGTLLLGNVSYCCIYIYIYVCVCVCVPFYEYDVTHGIYYEVL